MCCTCRYVWALASLLASWRSGLRRDQKQGRCSITRFILNKRRPARTSAGARSPPAPLPAHALALPQAWPVRAGPMSATARAWKQLASMWWHSTCAVAVHSAPGRGDYGAGQRTNACLNPVAWAGVPPLWSTFWRCRLRCRGAGVATWHGSRVRQSGR